MHPSGEAVDKSILTRHLLLCGILLAACFAVFSNALDGGFLQNWDDNKYVVENPAAHGFSAANIKAAFSTFYVGNYAPLQILSYALDYTFWKLNPFGYHLTNVLIHGMNGLLLYLVLWRLYRKTALSFFAALIFLVHPVQVESVAWIAQRKNLLAMFFFLPAVYCYLRRQERDKTWYFLSLGFFAAALLSKSVAVILPVALFLIDVTVLQKTGFRKIAVDKLPYVLLAGLCAILAIISQDEKYTGGITGYHGGSPFATFVTMGPVFVSYLRMLVWPTGLSALYSPQVRHSLFDPAVLAAFALLALIACGSFYLFGRRRDAAFWVWFSFLALLPVSQIVPLTTLMNDRYLYFPMIGIAALSGITVSGVAEAAAGGMRYAAAGIFAVLVAALAVAAYQRTSVWGNAYLLWNDAVMKSPGNRFAHQGLAEVLESRGDFSAAAVSYKAALKRDPGAAELHNQLGVVYMNLGDPPAALQCFRRAVQLSPTAPHAMNLGLAAVNARSYREAAQAFELAIGKSSDNLQAASALAAIYELLGDPQAARRYAGVAANLDRERSLLLIESVRRSISDRNVLVKPGGTH